jgi:hypothetical protein
MDARFHTTAAWHPSADGQSERTNQTVEIAIRFFLTQNTDLEWIDALPFIQHMINNSKNASTGTS